MAKAILITCVSMHVCRPGEPWYGDLYYSHGTLLSSVEIAVSDALPLSLFPTPPYRRQTFRLLEHSRFLDILGFQNFLWLGHLSTN